MITKELILALCPTHPNPATAALKLEAARLHWGLTSVRQVAMFLGQLAHESGLVPQPENLNYRAARIAQVWPSRFPTVESALPFAFNAAALANRVYANRMGNGDEASGDGFLFRGRGMLQLTGRNNYAQYAALVKQALLSQPDLLLQYGVSAEVAGAFWQGHGLNAAADRGDVRAVTLAINGGLIGLDDRERLYQRAQVAQRQVQGLLTTELHLDPVTDAAADLDARNIQFEQALSLLGA
ncbi:hypothetical protein MF271_19260 (plasmid) [Deinococcus sp. KNUC1210]|uniref:glycoside hydrolase family 19 protein n=1 Tax=Deinococcus sp. KNUC1210 TaxID=2917691 RepID=UPI001EF0CD30|nr:hypothetical protein [Deinococcus sp. KNUC1210]ULH17330.1 hypothetical protein MF271_19260 [Deinococcus sp. KNUC1210]